MKHKTTEEKRTAIINSFKTDRDNTIPALARKHNVSIYVANRIIDDYFKSLKTITNN